MKVKLHKRKPSRGGAVDLPTLMLADTFHDFWNCDRGQFKGESKLQALLNFGLVSETSKFVPAGTVTSMPTQPYSPMAGRTVPVAQYYDLITPANQIFTYLSGGNIIVSSIEESTAKYMGTPLPTFYTNLTEAQLQGDNVLFEQVVKTALGANYVEEDDVYIICDAGFGNMGKIGSKSGKLRGIITPQVIGDSANTSTKPIGNKSNIYFSPYDSDADINTFTSSSNLFTSAKYTVKYRNDGINDNNPYNFSLVIQDKSNQTKEYLCKFSPKSNTGPSAALLGGCYLASSLGAGGAELVFDSPTIKEGLLKQLKGFGRSQLRATSNVVDIWDAFGNKSLDPNIFIDLKRGGDRDQVKAGVLVSQVFNNVIFCTGDLLCATAAIKNGLPTILQYPKTSSKTPRPANITLWAKGIGQTPGEQWGGNMTPEQATQLDLFFKLSQETDKLSDEELLQSEDVTAEDLIRDAAAQASTFIKSLISDHYLPLAQLTQLFVVLDEINNVSGKSKTNNLIFSPLNSALLAFYNLSKTAPSIIVTTTTNLEKLKTDTQTMITSLNKSLTTEPEMYKQSSIRQTLLTSKGDTRYQEVCSDILAFLYEKYYGKLPNDGTSLQLFQTILLLLNPYTESGDIKMGHPGALPVVIPYSQQKNLYACGLVALSLINDMIDNGLNKGTSISTNILFGTSYNLARAPVLNNTAISINRYKLAMERITLSICKSTPESGYLLSKEVYGLLQTAGKRRHKTIKHRRFRLKKKYMKTQHKSK